MDWIWRFPGLQALASLGKNVLVKALRTGPVPRHIAFVMDGNRRFARARNQEVAEGHSAGFDTVARVLEMCWAVGIEQVTIYAFSIENFNRSQFEVKNLMDLTRARLLQVSEQGEMAERLGIRICILGDRKRLSPDVLEAVHKAEAATAKNSRATLNVCLPYTSRHEITQAIRHTMERVEAKQLGPEDICQETLQEFLCDDLDIFVRTSGVCRLSDFMVWQVHQGATIEFVDSLWPEFGFWDLYGILLRWSYKQSIDRKNR